MTRMNCSVSMESMADHDAFAALQAKNARLIALLESHGIEWRVPPKEPAPCVQEAEPSRFSTGDKVALKNFGCWRCAE
ncbi:hypothetical protein [Cupriavidus necator]